MSDIPPQSRFDRLLAWLRLLPGRGQRAWRYGSAYYHGGTAQRIITYIVFLTLLAIFLALFAGGVIGWLVEILDNLPTPSPPPLPPPTPIPGPTPIPVPLSYRLPAPVVETVSKFTETDVLRHYLAVAISIWVSVRIAALYFGDLHRIHRFRAASRLFRHMLLAWPFGRLDLAQGEMQTPQPNAQRLLGLLRVGVPVAMHIAADTCAVVEGIFAEPYVIGWTRGPQGNLLRGFSRLRRIVDLRDHTVTLDVDGHTRDGLALTGRGIGLTFSVYRNNRPVVDGSTYPYDDQAMLNLVYRTWRGGDFLPAMTAHLDSELRQFIAACPLHDFVNYSTRAAPEIVSRHQRSNPLHEFVTRFNAQARQSGIEAHWDGRGEWIVPAQVDYGKQLEAWRQNMLDVLPGDGEQPADSDVRFATLLRLIREVPLQIAEKAAQENLAEGDKMGALAQAYRVTLQEAARVYQARGQAVPEELTDVIDYLTQLISR